MQRLAAAAVRLLLVIASVAPASRAAGPGEPVSPSVPPTGTLTVLLSGVQAARGGAILVSLYDREDAWLKPDRARARLRVEVTGASAQAEFRDLPRGAYAVEVFHDANGNGTLDRRGGPIPLPTEGTDTSNNQRRMGPPLWNGARVMLDRGAVTVGIELRYY